MKKNRRSQGKRINKDMTVMNSVYVGLTLLANILLAWTVFNITRYSALKKELFVIVNIVALILIVLLNIVVVMMIRTKRINYVGIATGLLSILLLAGGYGMYVTSSINKNINLITNPGGNESVETSFVVYDDKLGMDELKDINGKIVGYVSATSYTQLGKDEIESQGLSVSYQEYQDYASLALALFDGQIEVGIFPSNYVGQLEVNEGLESDLQKTEAIHTFSKVVKSEVIQGANKDITSEPFTVLILGVDEGRSDALMVASVNPVSMRVTLTSIARDSYVPIACYSGQASDKIGHARVYSRECTINTVENLLDIEIDFYVESNFQGIVDMVDALGGITVYNEQEFVGQTSSSTRGIMTVYVPGGGNVYLNGEQALAFARERKMYASGDFQRQANQQQVITAILREVMRSQDINKILDMLDAAGQNVSTNFTTDQMIGFFNYTMNKTARFYDKEHFERIFDINSSRITGYDSGLWNSSTKTSLYIYRLWEGSIADTREAILRNLSTKEVPTAPKAMRWSANWIFDIPTIGETVYNETKIAPEVPPTVENFVGFSVGRLQSWAKVFSIPVNIRYIGEGMKGFDAALPDGTIVAQDVASGTSVSSIQVINVDVIKRGTTSTVEECQNGEVYDEKTGVCIVEKETYKVTVLYVDKATGKEITSLAYADEFENGKNYSITVQKQGYAVVEKADITVTGLSDNPYTFANGKVSGVIKDSNIVFTVKVTAQTSTYTLTIQYLDSTGAALQTATKVTLNAGAIHTIVPPGITGYKVTGYEGTTNGASVTMGTQNMTVTVRYKKEETPPTVSPTPDPPVISPSPELTPEPTESPPQP